MASSHHFNAINFVREDLLTVPTTTGDVALFCYVPTPVVLRLPFSVVRKIEEAERNNKRRH